MTFYDPECNLILRDVDEAIPLPSTSTSEPGEIKGRRLKHVMLVGPQVAAIEVEGVQIYQQQGFGHNFAVDRARDPRAAAKLSLGAQLGGSGSGG